MVINRVEVRTVAALALVAGCTIADAGAQGLPLPGFSTARSTVPLQIEAEKGVEWRQKEQIYVARGNATATRAETVLRAEILTAHYRKTSDNRQEIWKITAEVGVKITTTKDTITSDSAEYLVETGLFTLRGRPVTLDNGKGVLTAPLVTYDTKSRIARVSGGATVVEDKKRVRADRFVAYFKDGEGKPTLKTVEAFGNVIITTPGQVARGDRGEYNAESQLATLAGKVRLTRGDNQLNGERAEVNMKTGVSRLLAARGAPAAAAPKPAQKDKDRVRVLIIPGESESGKGPLDIPGPGSEGSTRNKDKR
jgi:lipopolysaccharide export system protein LptA